MKFTTLTARCAATLAAVAALAAPAAAQTPPSGKPLVLKVAYAPGGPVDVAARKLQAPLQAALGQPVIVENLPGAGGSIAAMGALGAPADGNTLLLTTLNDLILTPMSIAAVKFKPEQFRMVGTIFPGDFLLVTSVNHSFANVDDLVDATRKPGAKELTSGSWGYGTAPHLVTADFAGATGARVMDVPYKGMAPVVQALLTREIDMGFIVVTSGVADMVKTGKLKAVGVASPKRNPILPDVPSLSDGRNLKGFTHSGWAAVFAPAGVPDATVAKLHKLLSEITAGEDFQKFLRDSAALPVQPMSLDQYASYFRTEQDKYRRVAKAINLTPQ